MTKPEKSSKSNTPKRVLDIGKMLDPVGYSEDIEIKPDKCPKCDIGTCIIDVIEVLDLFTYDKKFCKKWRCKWQCDDCKHNNKIKRYKRWWCNHCKHNFDDEDAGIHTMFINMKNGGCKHIRLRDSDVSQSIKNMKK